ncbi:MAG: GNAT family N-acetyltransferase [Candidatus Krumholzibacteriota bacterium]|nr:GNAT family N-acetyltransferase [Candidatus Krumholzibacteriota bacterium]
MSGSLAIRPLRREEIPAAVALWRRAGISLTLSDRPEELARLLDHNPRTCLGGYEDGRLVATALGTFDGRRANLWHLAVDPDRQGRGLGRAMMEALEAVWRDMGVVKVTMFTVEMSNADVEGFYHRLGYRTRNDIFAMSKILREDDGPPGTKGDPLARPPDGARDPLDRPPDGEDAP